MEDKDYYQTLGIVKSASEADIKSAYRKQVRKFHPDVSQETNAEAKTKELNEAYAVLGDSEKRSAYDRLGSVPRSAGNPFRTAPGGNTDFFADLFAAAHGRRSHQPRRGADNHATFAIDLTDAYTGATRAINLRTTSPDGQGRQITQDRTINIAIPQGIAEGQQLRVAGHGQTGIAGGPAGDLYLRILFKPDPRYRIEGRNVYETVPVTPWEAMLGGPIELMTPSGKVTMEIPAKSQNGVTLRLKGRGIPGNPAGDLYLLLEVALPQADSEQARALYQTMARELAFNPRGL